MSVTSKKKLIARLRNKEFRDAYTAEHVKTSMPIQIRLLREQRGLTQGLLAQKAGTTQTVISRLEDPDYGNLSINSLLKLASGLDVALLVKLVPFSRLLDEFKNVSPQAVAAPSFDEEIGKLEHWADEASATTVAVTRARVQPVTDTPNMIMGGTAITFTVVPPTAAIRAEAPESGLQLASSLSGYSSVLCQDSTADYIN